MRPIVPVLVLLLSATPVAVRADDAPASSQPTIELGTVEVQGSEKIVAALQAIKVALKTPFSDDPAHANDPVCRIVKQLGEAREYLDCATNRDYSRRRDATQTAIMSNLYGAPAGADLLRGLIAKQPLHELHMPVNGGNLQALLARLPEQPVVVPAAAAGSLPTPVPAAATHKSEPPAASTGTIPPPTTQWW